MMSKPTLAIYGSKDLDSRSYPVFTHAHNLCVMQDGKILQYLDLERFTRRKYDNRLDLFIEELIENKTIDLPEEFDFVLANDFLSGLFISKNGKIRFECGGAKELKPEVIEGTLTMLAGESSVKKQNAFCLPHELAHIFSAVPFYGEFKENSILVSFDGASSLGNYSAFLYRNKKISLIENNWTDLGFASKIFNDNRLSFEMLGAKSYEHCSVPGKLMGFASWGKYDEKIEKWLSENDFFNRYGNFSKEEILSSIKNRFKDVCSAFDTHNQFLQDCAATLQNIFERAVLKKLETLQEKYHADYLYYGGGCALNIVTNTKIAESGLFKDVFIAPCCNDSGLSVGAAAFLEIQKGNKIALHSPYLCNAGLSQTDYEVSDSEIERTAEMIMQGKIIGICNGAAETGPRALGNRSLVALASSKELAQKLSMNVKKREWYRPVAPIMLLENAKLVAEQNVTSLARFMLQDFTVKEEYREKIAGVVHANNTARIQTISNEKENPFMFRLLKFLHEKHGVLALINTSFNAAGEPIVHTPEQAMDSAKKMNLDGIVINGVLTTLNNK
ncbi:MAG: hypothetical protein K6B43_03680 [Treponema sp.]|nr:hypothetical protein [Treponema sp.]